MGILDGIKVVDFGHYVAGPATGMLLANQGAEVVKIDLPGGPRFVTPANATWNRGKRSICLDLKNPLDQVTAKGLALQADVVIENFRPGVMDRLGLSYRTLRPENRGLIYTSLPGFGARDARRNIPAWEGVVLGAADVFRPATDYRNLFRQLHTVPAEREGDPVYTGEPIASLYAALVANLSISGALNARLRSGQGQHVEVPLLNALIQAIGIFGMARLPFKPTTSDAFGPWDHQYRCSDDRWIHLECVQKRQADAFAIALDRKDLIDRNLTNPEIVSSREKCDEVQRFLTETFGAKTALEWEELFVEHTIPGAMVRTTKEWLDHPQAQESLTVTVDDASLGETRQPGSLVTFSETSVHIDKGAPLPDEHRAELESELSSDNPFESDVPTSTSSSNFSPPLEGVRVLDLSIVLAGPTCGRTLAEFGADVIKINDPKLPEVQFHNDVNRGKRSILLDLTTEDGLEVFWQLVDTADVIIENFRSGVVESLGVDYESVKKRKPNIIYGSMNAYGQQGPWQHLPGYEETVEALTGFQARFGGPDSPRVWPYATINDYGTGLAMAGGVMLALLERSRSNIGQLVQGSLARTAGFLQSMHLLDHDDRQWTEPTGPANLGPSPEQRLYQCSDGWIFLGADDKASLTPIVGKTTAKSLGQKLSKWCQKRTAKEAVAELLQNDIGATKLVWFNDLMMDPVLVGAGLSVVREHGELGLLRTNGPGTPLSESTVSVGAPASKPGADAQSVLAEIGREDDLEQLIASSALRM